MPLRPRGNRKPTSLRYISLTLHGDSVVTVGRLCLCSAVCSALLPLSGCEVKGSKQPVPLPEYVIRTSLKGTIKDAQETGVLIPPPPHHTIPARDTCPQTPDTKKTKVGDVGYVRLHKIISSRNFFPVEMGCPPAVCSPRCAQSLLRVLGMT